MNALWVMVILVIATASALAYSPVALMDSSVSTMVHPGGVARESVTLVLSGGVLLAVAGALRRFTV